MLQRLQKLVTLWERSLPGRVLKRFSEAGGGVLANGLSFSALFSIFAIAWLAIGVFGIVLQSNDELWAGILQTINIWVPNLIDQGAGGIIDPSSIRPQLGAITWTSLMAIALLLFNALGWLEAARTGVHAMFDVRPDRANIVLLKLVDLATLLLYGVVVLASAAVTIFAGTAMPAFIGLVNDLTGFPIDSEGLLSVLSLAIAWVANFMLLWLLYRVIAKLRIDFRVLRLPLIIGAVLLTLMQAAASLLLGGATRNPLLAAFAAIIGLLIWFNLVAQVQLITAAWIAERVNGRASSDQGAETLSS